MKSLYAASRHLPRLYLPLLLVLCWVQNWRVLGGADDFWAHAAIGRWIAEHGQAPHQTLFLWGASQDWIAHSWGTQLWFYGLMHLGGERGGPYLALAFACAMISLSLALLWREWARRGHVSTLALLFFALGTTCAATRGRPRPELFSGVFFTVLLIFLLQEEKTEAPRSPKKWWGAAGIVAMFVVWANVHGQVATGLLLLALTALCDTAQAWFQKTNQRTARRALVLFGACALAININPYGWHYWSALNPVVGPMFKQIDEWKPVWKPPQLDPFFPASGFLLVFFALLAWLGTEKRRWAHGAWLLVWVALMISARRHLWMLSLVGLAVLAANAKAVQPSVFWQALRNIVWKGDNPEIPPRARAIVRWTLVVFMVVVIARQTPTVWLSRWPNAVSKKLPSGAAAKLHELNLKHSGLRLINDYEYSSYWHWRLKGDPPLFIDLLNAYPDHLLFDYFDVLKAETKGRKLMERSGVNCVVLRPHKPKDSMGKLSRYLDANRAWRRVYKREDATIWLKVP